MESERRRERERRDRWSAIRRLVGPFRGHVIALALPSFLAGIVEAAFLVVATRAALAIADDEGVLGSVAGLELTIGETVWIGLVLVVLRFVLAYIGVVAGTRLNAAVVRDLRMQLADAYLHASWAIQQDEPSGRLQQLVQGFTNQARTGVNFFTSSVIAGLSLLALVVMALVVDPLATAAVVLALGVLGSFLTPLRRRIRARAQEASRAELRFGDSVSELGALGIEMQAFGVRDQFGEQIGALVEDEVRTRQRTELLRSSVNPVYTSLAYLAIIAAIGGASAVGAGELGAVGAVMLLMLRSLSYGQTLQASAAGLASVIPFVDTIEETLASYRAHRATSGPVVVDRVGPIVADRVSFAYQDDIDVLRDLSFRIEPGEIIGVVGPSGSGKSTLVQLLLGLRDPNRGTITVDGVDLRSVDRSSWTQRIAFVPQEALLYSATVEDNIRFFRDGVSEERVRVAAREAHVAGDVDEMPEQYRTVVGERGSRVSGGQRQRLSIARALAGDPELLILDEPTSSLDVRSESLIRDTLEGLRGKVTVVVIAHRMSTLEVCDRIMVIQHGELKAFAPKAELSLSSDFYREALELSGLS